MTKIISYLTFNGNCREAMTFYQSCLGGELNLMTIGDSPMADRIPTEMKNHILHASLRRGSLTLMASDMVSDEGLNRGNGIAMMLDCESEAELRSCYDRLATGGQSLHPIENTFWGALFGDLSDQYGNQWLLHFAESSQM